MHIVVLVAIDASLRRTLIGLIHVALSTTQFLVGVAQGKVSFVMLQRPCGPAPGRVAGCTLLSQYTAMRISFLVALYALSLDITATLALQMAAFALSVQVALFQNELGYAVVKGLL